MDDYVRPFAFLNHAEFISRCIPRLDDVYKIYGTCDGLTYLILYLFIGYLFKTCVQLMKETGYKKIGCFIFWENVFLVWCIPMAINTAFEYYISTRWSFDWTEKISIVLAIFILLFRYRDEIMLRMFRVVAK